MSQFESSSLLSSSYNHHFLTLHLWILSATYLKEYIIYRKFSVIIKNSNKKDYPNITEYLLKISPEEFDNLWTKLRSIQQNIRNLIDSNITLLRRNAVKIFLYFFITHEKVNLSTIKDPTSNVLTINGNRIKYSVVRKI